MKDTTKSFIIGFLLIIIIMLPLTMTVLHKEREAVMIDEMNVLRNDLLHEAYISEQKGFAIEEYKYFIAELIEYAPEGWTWEE